MPPRPTDPKVRYYRQLRARIEGMDDAERAAFIGELSPEDRQTLLAEWRLWARDDQLEPGTLNPDDADWEVWAIKAGRGWGKTATGANALIRRVQSGRSGRSGIIAPTAADARDVCVEGESGIMRNCHPDRRPLYEPSKRRLTWPNGAITTTYSADEPDRLRGPQHDFLWGDEPSTWKYPEAWSNARLGLRLGARPQAVLTFTPKRLKWLTDLMEQPTTFLTNGSTYDNRANLAASFIAEVERLYEGTRLGRQELHGEVLGDVEGALWHPGMLDEGRVRFVTNEDGTLDLPPIKDVVVAIDPAGSKTGDETGIIVAARDIYGVGYVLDDRSLNGSPDEWGSVAWAAAIEWGADRFVIEDNAGGDALVTVLEATKPQPEYDDHGELVWSPPTVRVQRARARTSKWQRAEAISALTTRRRVRLVGVYPQLEDQLTTWTEEDRDSPDRLDAFVWAMRSLLVEDSKKVRIIA